MGSPPEVDSTTPYRESSLTELPPRLFAVDEEPKGIRVTAYHKSRYIPAILSSLSVEETDFMRKSPFGKLISLSEEPAFSGRFGRFLISRQLITKKKHEAWFLFAGVPVRFSLREFAIVTGLPCGKFSKKSKKRMRRNISETPYWPSLFGKLDNVQVSSVIRMLKNRTVTDRDTRIKYACLALVSSVLLPSSHYPKISKDHVELIKDLDVFLAYPWGRLSFHLLMSNIKERNEISLSQDTVAVPGFGLAIQLVMTEAVPALLEVVQEGAKDSSGSDREEEDDQEVGGNSSVTISLHPGHARNLDKIADTQVQSIIDGDLDESTVEWSDEEDDPRVQTLIELIEAGTKFNKEMFKGGATKADVQLMREEEKAKRLFEEKQSKRKKKQTTTADGNKGCASIVASVLIKEMKDGLLKLDHKVNNCCLATVELKNSIHQLENRLENQISARIATSQTAIITTLKKCILESSKRANDPSGAEGTASMNHPSDQFERNLPTYHHTSGEFENPTMEKHDDTPATTKDTVHSQPTGVIVNKTVLSASGMSPTTVKMTKPVTDVDNDTPRHDHARNNTVLSDNLDENEEALSMPSFSLQITQTERELAAEEAKGKTDNGGNDCAGTREQLWSSPVVNNGEEDFLMPSFSIGLTQEEILVKVMHDHAHHADDDSIRKNDEKAGPTVEQGNDVNEDVSTERRGIKQQKYGARVGLVGSKYGFMTPHRGRGPQMSSTVEGDSATIRAKYEKLLIDKLHPFPIRMAHEVCFLKEICEIGERKSYLSPKLVDVLMKYTTTLFTGSDASAAFFNSKFASILSRNYPKFKKLQRKGVHQFGEELVCYFNAGNFCVPVPDRFYFPFNVDRRHWIGLCVDFTEGVLIILDCNVVIRTDAAITKEFTPIAEMFPYLLRQSGRKLSMRELKPLTIQRPRSVPQNVIRTDSGVTAVLLMQAHAIGGVEMCNCITPETIAMESQKLAVMVYEEYNKLL